MSLSKKSRYVPPHLRENNKNIVVVNPDDEMPPPPPKRVPMYGMGRGPPPPMYGAPPPYGHYDQYGGPPPGHGPPPSYYNHSPPHSPQHSPINGHRDGPGANGPGSHPGSTPPNAANPGSNGVSTETAPLDAPPNLPKMQPKPDGDGNSPHYNHDDDGHHDSHRNPNNHPPGTPPNGAPNRDHGGSPFMGSKANGHGSGSGFTKSIDSGARRYKSDSPIQKDWRSAPKLQQPDLILDQNNPESSNGARPHDSRYGARPYESRRYGPRGGGGRGRGRYGHRAGYGGGYGPLPPMGGPHGGPHGGHPHGGPPDEFYDDEDPNEAAFKKLGGDHEDDPNERGDLRDRGFYGQTAGPFMGPPDDEMYQFGGRGRSRGRYRGRGRDRGRGRGRGGRGIGRGRGRGRGARGGSSGVMSNGRGKGWDQMDESVELEMDLNRRGTRRRSSQEDNVVDGDSAISPANMAARSGGSRYNRQYVSPGNAPRQQPDVTEMVVNGDANYELSEDFQALSTRKGPASRVRRRRSTKKNANPNATNGAKGVNGPNTIIGTLNGNNTKNTPKKQTPNKKAEKPTPKQQATNANAVPLSVPKARPAPVNWAANLKAKPVPPQSSGSSIQSTPTKSRSPMTGKGGVRGMNQNGDSRPRSGSAESNGVNGVNGTVRTNNRSGQRTTNHSNGVPNGKASAPSSSFQPHPPVQRPQRDVRTVSPEMMDSSLYSPDALKVQHVLEVVGMSAAEYQSVLGLFRRFDIETSALLSVKRRWFVCFDTAELAVHAINVVRDGQFKLRRIDCNVADVQMLKNNVPPPLRKTPSPNKRIGGGGGAGPSSGSGRGRGRGMGRGRGGALGANLRSPMDPMYQNGGHPAKHQNGKSAVWGQ